MATVAKPPAREPAQCARPGCPHRFIPVGKNHKYCSPACKQRVHAYRFALNGGR